MSTVIPTAATLCERTPALPLETVMVKHLALRGGVVQYEGVSSLRREEDGHKSRSGRGFKSRHLHVHIMTPVRDLNGGQAQEIEEQLFTTHRQQLPRHVPVPLPRQDFWEMVRALLSSLDLEIQNMVRKGSIDMRLQNLQKRQTNIRRIASELARKRMVAMMQHAASQALRSGVNPGMGQDQELPRWIGSAMTPQKRRFTTPSNSTWTVSRKKLTGRVCSKGCSARS